MINWSRGRGGEGWGKSKSTLLLEKIQQPHNPATFHPPRQWFFIELEIINSYSSDGIQTTLFYSLRLEPVHNVFGSCEAPTANRLFSSIWCVPFLPPISMKYIDKLNLTDHELLYSMPIRMHLFLFYLTPNLKSVHFLQINIPTIHITLLFTHSPFFTIGHMLAST